MPPQSDPRLRSDDPASDVTSDPQHPEARARDDEAVVHREWAHLRIIEEIGRGGFGRVYRAWDTTLAREVALKLVPLPELDPAAASQVLHEGRMLARVRHPNVVTVFGALEVGCEFGLWMELVRGRSLADVVRKDGPFGPEEAAVIALSVCRALAAVHAAGLVHRDVKAQNVMREAGGRILLMDFGAGWDPTVPGTHTVGHAPGTPNYMAPEVIAGHEATAVSDLYSVGVLLYYLVTGKHPFEGRTLADIAVGQSLRRRRLLTDDRPDVPEGFVRIVDRALAIDPKDRYQTAGGVIQDLTEALPVTRSAWSGGAYSGDTQAPTTPLPQHSADTPRSQPGLATPASTQRGGDIAAARSPWRPVLAWGAPILIVPWVLGFLTSMGLNNTLGRATAFAGESPFAWWVWGIRVLIAPLVYISAAIVAFFLIRSAWRLARRLSGAFDAWCARVGRAVDRAIVEMRLADLGTRGQLLLLVQAVVMALLLWRFHELILAQTTLLNEAERAEAAALSPANLVEHAAYGWSLDAFVFVFGASWFAIARARRRQGLSTWDVSLAGGVIVIVLSLVVLWTLPYRITWHNEFPKVLHGAERCYVIGQRENDLLLHCPDLPPPRNRVIPRGSGGLKPSGTVESIFTAPAESR